MNVSANYGSAGVFLLGLSVSVLLPVWDGIGKYFLSAGCLWVVDGWREFVQRLNILLVYSDSPTVSFRGCWVFRLTSTESLILAQDERWRRA